VAPDTINTMPEKTLLAFASHGKAQNILPQDGGDAELLLDEFVQAGINHASYAIELQREGALSFKKSWRDLMDCIESKGTSLTLDHLGKK
jgi:transaldolase